MKTIFSIILSLIVAAGLCLALMKVGVFKYNMGDTEATLHTVTQKVASVTEGLKAHPVLSSSSLKKGRNPGHEAFVYDKSLNFLKSFKDKGGVNVEDQFSIFLRRDLGLDAKEQKRFLRMGFWKNFVTLQEQWQPGERHEMEMAFEREKELKRAGFAAKGLTLMAGELEKAEARFRQLQMGLSGAADKRERQ